MISFGEQNQASAGRSSLCKRYLQGSSQLNDACAFDGAHFQGAIVDLIVIFINSRTAGNIVVVPLCPARPTNSEQRRKAKRYGYNFDCHRLSRPFQFVVEDLSTCYANRSFRANPAKRLLLLATVLLPGKAFIFEADCFDI
jgi:hypothetical protein